MNRKTVVIGVASVVAAILAACGGHDNSGGGSPPTSSTPPPTTPPSTDVAVTTGELLMNYATMPSETATPLPVNAGAFTITDTSDTSTPITVIGN